MNVIQPDYLRIISLPFEGKGWTTLMYHPSLQLIDSGTMNRGQAAWAQLKLENTVFSVAVVYAPSDSPCERAYLWHQLKMELPDGHWFIFGDFNMIETTVDSFGPSPLIQGRQLEAWRLLVTCLDLIDTYYLARNLLGTRFTRRLVHEHCLDQSRLDHFYINDKAKWIHVIIKLEHVQNQTLSDHDLILLTF